MMISCSFPRATWHFFHLLAKTICTLLFLHWFVIPYYICIYYICFVLYVLTAWFWLSALKMFLPVSSYAPSATIPHFSALLHGTLCTQFQTSHLHHMGEALLKSLFSVWELSAFKLPWVSSVSGSSGFRPKLDWSLTLCLNSTLTGELIAYFMELIFFRCWKYFLICHF